MPAHPAHATLHAADAPIAAGALVFVVNPRARRALPATLLADVFMEACRPWGFAPHVVETRSAAEAEQVAQIAEQAGAAAVFGCGGDGALHAILQGLTPGSPLPLGCVPLGTTNVWATEAAVATTPMAAVRQQIEALLRPPTWIDTGRVSSPAGVRRFLLMAGYGLDALAVDRVNQRAKRVFGKWAYGIAGGLVLLGDRGLPLRLTFDDHPGFDARVGMMTLGNTRLYGGVAMLTHLASAVDGELDAVIFRGPAAQALATTPLALRGLHPNAPGVSYHRFQRLIIEGGPTLESQLDGEVGPQEARVVEVEPSALRVLVPDAGQAIFGAAGGLG